MDPVPVHVEDTDAVPIFRAPVVAGKRRPLRLETLYWSALSSIGRERDQKLAEVIESFGISQAAGNATSMLRVAVLKWTMQRIGQLKKLASMDVVRNIVRASTAPTFVLGQDRRILFFNHQFEDYIRRRIPAPQRESGSELRLVFDMQMDDLVASLRNTGNRPVLIGFAVGYNERRLRGQMNALLHPADAGDVILGFVIPER